MIRTRKLTPAEVAASQPKPANGYHTKLRSPQRGKLIGVRLQADTLAEIDRRLVPNQSRADFIRTFLIRNL